MGRKSAAEFFTAREARARRNPSSNGATVQRLPSPQLARESDILHSFALDIAAAGVVGEERNAQLLYLALTSRLLDQPVSIAVKGASSAGKSHLVRRLLPFFPPSAYIVLTAMSEKALVYSSESVSHRFLVINEAAGISGDFAIYAVRSLLSEGRLSYETVEKTKEGGFQSRRIEREGPTGLIVTTTALRLHPENETRLFSISIDDSPQQTKRVLLAVADDAAGLAPEAAINLEMWQEMQTWLSLGYHNAVVPFARELVSKMPPYDPRLRRDSKAVFSLIRAHALLHQTSRVTDKQERVIATLDDYRHVYEIVSDLVAEGVDATVSSETRATVEVVAALTKSERNKGISISEIGSALGLNKGTASRRVTIATERGFLRNLEEKAGVKARIVLDEALPQDVQFLPHPDEITHAVAPLRVARKGR